MTNFAASLPDGLEIKKSAIPNAGLGIFATKKLDVGVHFGPYQGEKVLADLSNDNLDARYMWEVMDKGKVVYYIDGTHGNWMRYINCSRVEDEQNLVAYQYHKEVYHCTYKEIDVGEELLIWYGTAYAKNLGINLNENQIKRIDQDAPHCKTRFMNQAKSQKVKMSSIKLENKKFKNQNPWLI